MIEILWACSVFISITWLVICVLRRVIRHETMVVTQNWMKCFIVLSKERYIKLYSLAIWCSVLDNRKSNTSLFKSVKTFSVEVLCNRNSTIMKPTSFKAQLDQFIKWEIRRWLPVIAGDEFDIHQRPGKSLPFCAPLCLYDIYSLIWLSKANFILE